MNANLAVKLNQFDKLNWCHHPLKNDAVEKVILVLLDGTRYDMTAYDSNVSMSNFWYKNNLNIFELYAEKYPDKAKHYRSKLFCFCFVSLFYFLFFFYF